MKRRITAIALLLALSLIFSACALAPAGESPTGPQPASETNGGTTTNPTGQNGGTDPATHGTDGATIPAARGEAIDPSALPPFSGTSYCTINGGVPTFREEELSRVSYEFYSPLDELKRCGYTVASVGRDIMPTEKRGDISSVKPTGWVQARYTNVSGGYLYNRCHLIGFQLTGENANKQNLITGTRYMNEAMIPYENMIADFVKETGYHVMYRVEPIFIGDNLLASGVHMEAWSVEDGGDGICFNVYLYNAQPGIAIDYATGESALAALGEAPYFTVFSAGWQGACAILPTTENERSQGKGSAIFFCLLRTDSYRRARRRRFSERGASFPRKRPAGGQSYFCSLALRIAYRAR